MGQFVAASESEVKLTDRKIDIKNSKQDQRCVEKRALRQDEEALCTQRQKQRQCRQQEDAAFRTLKAQRRAQQQGRQSQIQQNQRPPWGSKKAADEQWKAIRQQRQEQMQQRQQEDEQWRMKREQLRLRGSQIQSIAAWFVLISIRN